MRKLFYIGMRAILCLSATLWCSCNEKEEQQAGSLSGSVIDKDTDEKIMEATVALVPGGLETATDIEGYFKFNELEPRTYKIKIKKTGYVDYLSDKIVVGSGQAIQVNVKLEKLPPMLRIVNANGQDIYEIYFGEDETLVKSSFSIFNAGNQPLQWKITHSAVWITDISTEEGILEANKTQTIAVSIDREQLKSGDNEAFLLITSTGGNKKLMVTAIGEKRNLPVVNMMEVSDVKITSAILHGRVTDAGSPEYTERGFVYSLSSMPTLENTISKLTVAVTDNSSFQSTATDLEEGKTYYGRAYAINKLGTTYSSNEVSFVPQKSLPIVKTDMVTNKSIAMGRATLNGTIEYVGEPAYIERGAVYGSTHNPTIEDAITRAATGSWSGEYAVNLTDLAIGEVYYVRAYATNDAGTAYGDEVKLDFNPILPKITTLTITDVDEYSATLWGMIESIGDPVYTEAGFVYGTMSKPSLDDASAIQVSVVKTGTGAYSKKIENLNEGETYYVRAYLRNEHYTVYGGTYSFKTENPYYVVLPAVGLMVQKEDLGYGRWETAKSMCENSIVAGFTDWRLPTKDELMTLYNNKNRIGGFPNDRYYYYWSSTPCESENAYGSEEYYYMISFENGSIHCVNAKPNYYSSDRVRAVRTIK